MDAIIIGAGPAGATAARILAQRGKRVLLLERRSFAGGNCYDERDEHGIIVHRYGPHIFHTDDEKTFSFLSRFTQWTPYRHQVTARVGDRFIPVPFSLESLAMCFAPEEARPLRERLVARYGMDARTNILSLMGEEDPLLKKLGEYVYEHIFRHYSEKQWGCDASTLDGAVLARVPVCVSPSAGYFPDRFQCMPKDGYAQMVERMLAHPNIDLRLGEDGARRLDLSGDRLCFDGQPCDIPVIYTGALDELYRRDMGPLPYRTLSFAMEHLAQERFQPTCVVNYTVSERFTRITEYKYLTGCEDAPGTTICREYSAACTHPDAQIPYYPIPNGESRALYEGYARRTAKYPGLILLGRLAQYRYYDMDDIVKKAISVAEVL